jgi:hypothetical protein
MYHAKTSPQRMQEGFFELIQLPDTPRGKKHKKIKKEDITIQLQDLMKFFRGNYL